MAGELDRLRTVAWVPEAIALEGSAPNLCALEERQKAETGRIVGWVERSLG